MINLGRLLVRQQTSVACYFSKSTRGVLIVFLQFRPSIDNASDLGFNIRTCWTFNMRDLLFNRADDTCYQVGLQKLQNKDKSGFRHAAVTILLAEESRRSHISSQSHHGEVMWVERVLQVKTKRKPSGCVRLVYPS